MKIFNLIVLTALAVAVPVSGYAAALRLARLARLLKLVNKIPQLKLIISGLVGGLRAILYIMLLLVMVFYFYAILGMTCFMKNDPWHWGHFGYAMETLFRMATMEDWTEIMYINYYGCDYWCHPSPPPPPPPLQQPRRRHSACGERGAVYGAHISADGRRRFDAGVLCALR